MWQDEQEKYMSHALECARKAFDAGEIPVGAVVIDEHGEVIAQAENQVERQGSQRFHAEMIALEAAARQRGDWRLEGCWLFVTLEPCVMCLGAIGLSRLSGLVYAASSPDFGGYQFPDLAQSSLYFGRLAVVRGLKEEESVAMLRLFFKRARGEKS